MDIELEDSGSGSEAPETSSTQAQIQEKDAVNVNESTENNVKSCEHFCLRSLLPWKYVVAL